ncbi:SERP3 protein, partial [Nothocercus julius]|nr:SERP3 protein [Nothocercus julius]
LASMLPVLFTASILSACCLPAGSCLSHDDLRERKTEFAIRLYQHVARAGNGSSLVLSPASVAASLELLQLGAQGNTLAELRDALGYSILGKALLARILLVAIASRCAASSDPGFRPVCAVLSAPPPSLLRADGSVPGVSLESAASPLNQVAVVSTMYFKSTWQKTFSFLDTQILPFTTAEGSTLEVPTMHHTAEVNYGQFRTASPEALSVLELPYVGEEISMFVLLPGHNGSSLSHLESHLSAKAVALWANSLKRMKMEVFLPRFSIQSNFDLKTAFSAMGITDMFDPINADFRGISEQGGLYVSEAIHKAKIEVAEDGTKASGAAAMVLLKRSRTPVFKADRPFTFFLRQANTGMQTSTSRSRTI